MNNNFLQYAKRAALICIIPAVIGSSWLGFNRIRRRQSKNLFSDVGIVIDGWIVEENKASFNEHDFYQESDQTDVDSRLYKIRISSSQHYDLPKGDLILDELLKLMSDSNQIALCYSPKDGGNIEDKVSIRIPYDQCQYLVDRISHRSIEDIASQNSESSLLWGLLPISKTVSSIGTRYSKWDEDKNRRVRVDITPPINSWNVWVLKDDRYELIREKGEHGAYVLVEPKESIGENI